MVFILFVIMLLDLKGEKGTKRLRFQRLFSILFTLLLLFFLIGASAHMISESKKTLLNSEMLSSFGGVKLFGKLLFSDYLLSFEVASVLLLVAMIGAVVFGKKRP